MPKYESIVILTGAGISAESGIQTFRAQDGLWENHRIEDVATFEGFERDPDLVQRFYNLRREPLLNNEVLPNPAHKALAVLEQSFSGKFTLITQNIDDLHEQAGSQNVLHMHGEILKMRCQQSQRLFRCDTAISSHDLCECCRKAGNLRPHIVWFGEIPLFMEIIEQTLLSCDLFVSIGTSGSVYPAAGFVQMANNVGAKTIEINLEQSNVATDFDEAVYGRAGDVLPIWVDEFLVS